MKPGLIERREHSYIRHGTQCLTPNFDVTTGQISFYTIRKTRKEKDFAEHIENTVAMDPNAEWIFVLDQLNTHKSESLVCLVARLCGISDELGVKGKCGLLINMQTRMEFLENQKHRIRFVYTPKHCSWLNQVEIWFSIISKRLLRRGNFRSIQNLQEQIRSFIKYFNKTMAHPFRWTYSSKILCTK